MSAAPRTWRQPDFLQHDVVSPPRRTTMEAASADRDNRVANNNKIQLAAGASRASPCTRAVDWCA